MARGEALFRAEILGADRAARQMAQAAGRVTAKIDQEFKGRLQEEVTQAMKNVAPEETGLLKDIIESRISYPSSGHVRVTVRSEVRDPATNYPYTGVTRFGHKKPWIRAKHETSPEAFAPGAKTIAGDPKSQFYLDKGHAPALAVHAAGRYAEPIYRSRVRGYRPAGDWVERGVAAADRIVAEAADRVGRAMETEVLR